MESMPRWTSERNTVDIFRFMPNTICCVRIPARDRTSMTTFIERFHRWIIALLIVICAERALVTAR
jgi:hypothetical protein